MRPFPPPASFSPRTARLFFAGALAWVAAGFAASIFLRRSRGKPVFPGKPEGALYFQRFGSGNSRKNWITMIGGARNCLTVAVTPTELIVQPFFPFNLMFLPEIYDLDHRIPRTNITLIEDGKTLYFWRTIRIDYEDAERGPRSISLMVPDADAFLKALGPVGARH